MNLIPRFTPRALALAVAACAASPLLAQTPALPDAGQSLQPLRPQPELPRTDTPLRIQPGAAPSAAPGGPQVRLEAIRLSGHTVFDDATLAALVADALGQSLDLAGLQALAARIGDHYRASGYPFARAYLPPQDLAGGVLRIEVLEGRYGRVQVVGADAGFAAQAQAFLEPLQPGAVIASAALERSTLLLTDLPGVSATPVMRPGSETGTGDLAVQLDVDRRAAVRVGIDNQGNRYSGRDRVHLDLGWRSLLRLGDELSLFALGSSESLWLGSVGYALPLGGDGWRANVGWARTRYRLGQEFAAADAHGTARVASLGVSQVPWRSQRGNLRLGATWQHKALQDARGTQRDEKTSDSVLLNAQLDARDEHGVSVAQLGWTPGRLRLPEAQRALDVNGTAGAFHKLQLDLLRQQALPLDAELFARFSSQWASRNLDSSERLTAGGSGGVRAHASGEGTGDRGWLLQLELRRRIGPAVPYVFYDAAAVRVNAEPQPGTERNRQRLAGGGFGVRASQDGWDGELSFAWRRGGTTLPADPNDRRQPRVGFSLARAF